MANLKCAKCGAEITEEQLTCSVCGFVNDIEVCKKLAGQEEIALQEKAEKEQVEKLAEQKQKVAIQQEELYKAIKISSVPFVLLRILGDALFAFALIGFLGNLFDLTSKANQLSLGESYKNPFILAGLRRSWSGEGICIIFIVGGICSTLATMFKKMNNFSALSKKMKEIDFDGKTWLKEFKATNGITDTTLEKALKKQPRNYMIAVAYCDSLIPEAKIKQKKILSAVLDGVITCVMFSIFIWVGVFDLVASIFYGGVFNINAIIGVVILVVGLLIEIVASGIIDGKATKLVSEELKKFDVQPAQPEQNA